jgi:uncharacterized membrane protein
MMRYILIGLILFNALLLSALAGLVFYLLTSNAGYAASALSRVL